MPLNPYDLCPECGGRGLIAVGISDINAICPECDGSGNGETTRLRDRIAQLEAKLTAVPRWTRIDPQDRSTWPPSDNAWVLNYNEQVMFVTWGSVLNQVDLIRHGKQWWMPITPPETEP